MQQQLLHLIREATGATNAHRGEVIQSLWSGYGEIVRIHLDGATVASVVLKHVRFPTEADHPRGWHSDFGHVRKVKSYNVEMAWYGNYANRCGNECRVPHCHFATTLADDEHLILLEDLDSAGYPLRKDELNRYEVEACLTWLADFHATFMNDLPDGLWNIGSYWHLDTRPDEWRLIEDASLKAAASEIDEKLNSCKFKTLVHGDAKVANFCFSVDGRSVAAVDFQYVGGGCGMKDVAYFLGSCLDEALCEAWEKSLLDFYFAKLEQSLNRLGVTLNFKMLEREWRDLYAVAWADFYRFLAGWMPGHWKVNNYSRRLTREVIASLG